METVFSVNSELDIPIYRQLVDQIRAAVRQGRLTAGQKLPTVQEVSCDLSIAVGTIKRAYDENVLFVYKDKAKLLVSTLNGSEAAVLGASALGWE